MYANNNLYQKESIQSTSCHLTHTHIHIFNWERYGKLTERKKNVAKKWNELKVFNEPFPFFRFSFLRLFFSSATFSGWIFCLYSHAFFLFGWGFFLPVSLLKCFLFDWLYFISFSFDYICARMCVCVCLYVYTRLWVVVCIGEFSLC